MDQEEMPRQQTEVIIVPVNIKFISKGLDFVKRFKSSLRIMKRNTMLSGGGGSGWG